MIVIILLVLVIVTFKLALDVNQKWLKLSVIFCALAIGIELFGVVNKERFDKQYQDWKLKREIELVSLSNTQVSEGGGGILYVSISAENVYSYRYEIDSKFGTDTSREYVVDVVSGNVEEIEDVNCKEPILREYKSKFGIGLWRIMFPAEVTKYVFYVPEGTIQKDITLK